MRMPQVKICEANLNDSVRLSVYSVRAIANWVLDFAQVRSLEITNMALNKLVYFVFEAALLRRGRVLTGAKIEAWDHGPVFRELYHDFKKFGDKPITIRASRYSVVNGCTEIVAAAFDPEDEKEMIAALAPIITLSASQLRALSHARGGAWDRVWSYKGHANPGMEITTEIIFESAGQSGGGEK